MTFKVKVNYPNFQYQPRLSHDACLVQIWWFQSYRAGKVKFTDGRTQATTIFLGAWKATGLKMVYLMRNRYTYVVIEINNFENDWNWCLYARADPGFEVRGGANGWNNLKKEVCVCVCGGWGGGGGGGGGGLVVVVSIVNTFQKGDNYSIYISITTYFKYDFFITILYVLFQKFYGGRAPWAPHSKSALGMK